MEQQQPVRLKLLIQGKRSSRKTAVLQRYADKEQKMGVDFKNKNVTIEDVDCQLNIWEIASQEKFWSMNINYCQGANGAMVLYSLSDRKSFEKAHALIERIKEANDSLILIVVGNKTDENRRCVTKEEGQELANHYNCLFTEISLDDDKSIDNAFDILIRSVLFKEKIIKSPTPPSNGQEKESQIKGEICTIF